MYHTMTARCLRVLITGLYWRGVGLNCLNRDYAYSSFPSSGLQQNPQNRSRMRAASSTLPLNLDLRTQFRSVGSGHTMQSSAHSPTSRPNTTSQLGGVSSSYTASFPSAPLTAPIDFSLPRTPGFRSTGQDYSMPQMSAPIAPPNDFSQASRAWRTTTPGPPCGIPLEPRPWALASGRMTSPRT